MIESCAFSHVHPVGIEILEGNIGRPWQEPSRMGCNGRHSHESCLLDSWSINPHRLHYIAISRLQATSIGIRCTQFCARVRQNNIEYTLASHTKLVHFRRTHGLQHHQSSILDILRPRFPLLLAPRMSCYGARHSNTQTWTNRHREQFQ